MNPNYIIDLAEDFARERGGSAPLADFIGSLSSNADKQAAAAAIKSGAFRTRVTVENGIASVMILASANESEGNA